MRSLAGSLLTALKRIGGRGLLAVVLVAGGTLVGHIGAGAAASPSTCAGGDLAAGTYPSLTITGLCYLPNGVSVTVDGNLTISSGAMLDAISPGGTALLGSALPGNLTVTRDISVDSNAVLLLGWCIEPNAGVGYENCDPSQLASSDDKVGGSISAMDALVVIIHGVRTSGNLTIRGGGGGSSLCVLPSLFSEDTDPAVNGSQTVGYDFEAVNYSDVESSTIAGNAQVENLNACWFGAVRDTVHGNFIFRDNTTLSGDGNEVVGNQVKRNMSCERNAPAVQFGDSNASPNQVNGKATGQCAAPISVKG